MTCEQLQDAYEAYVLGTLEGPERADLEREIRAHLARGCPVCSQAVAESQRLFVHLGLAAPAAEPPPALRRRILDQIAASAAPARPPLGRRWQWAFGAAAVATLALLLVAIGLRVQIRTLQGEAQNLHGILRTQRDRERDLLRQLVNYREAMRLIATPGARVVQFGPAQPTGKLFLQPGGLVMIASSLPQPPPGRTYELWLIAQNRPAPIPAGVFHPDAAGSAIHVWREPIDAASIKAIAVSDEPPGGVPAPTGKILFSAPVQ